MRYPMRLCLLASTLALASCFGNSTPPQPISHLPVADLAVELEPKFSVEQAKGEAGYEAFNQAVLDWGRRGWSQVARACRWTAEHGVKLDCPADETSQKRQ